MATIRAVFRLEDQASGTMAAIARKAAALDKALAGLDERLGTVDDRSEQFASNFQRRTRRMNEGAIADITGIRRELTQLNRDLTSTQHKRTLIIDADISRATSKIDRLRERAGRNMTLGVSGGSILGAVGGGGAAGILGRAASTREGKMSGSMLASAAMGIDNLAKSIGSARIQLGFMSARIASLPAVLALIGPPVMAVLAAGLSVLSGAIAGVAAAAVGLTAMLGALTFGIAALAIPVAMATKKFGENNKEVDKAKKKLDAANKAMGNTNKYLADGITVSSSYTKAVARQTEAQAAYDKALSKVSPKQREINSNLDKLKSSWNDAIMGGRTGARAVWMMNEALVFANSQMPWIEKMFDRFSVSGVKLFRSMTRESGRFRRVLDASTDEWPARFEEIGAATGHFTMGLLGVLRAGESLTEWMSKGLLENMEDFSKWANGNEGQMKMRRFFEDMKPIIDGVGDVLWEFGAAILNVAQQDKGDIIYFLQEIDRMLEGLPGLIDLWTDKFRGAWPAIRSTGKSLFDFFENIAGAMGDIKDGAIWIGDHMPGAIKRGFGALKDVDLPEAVGDWATLLGSLGLVAGGSMAMRGATRGLGGAGRRGTRVGKRGLGGGLTETVAAGVVPVFVTNPGFGGVVGAGDGAVIAGAAAAAGKAPLIVRAARVTLAATAAYVAWESVSKLAELGAAGVFSGPGGTGFNMGNEIKAEKIANGFKPLFERMGEEVAKTNERFAAASLAKFAGVKDPKVIAGIRDGSIPVDFRPKRDPVRDFMSPFEGLAWGTSKVGGIGGALAIGANDNHWFNRMGDAARKAMDAGRAEVNIGGAKIVLAYNKKIDEIELRRIDLSGFFADMWQKFRTGVGELGTIVQSVTGPLESFWSALTGGGGAVVPATPGNLGSIGGAPVQGPTMPAQPHGHRQGDGQKGAGPLGRIRGAMSGAKDWLGGVASGAGDVVSRVVGWLQNKGHAGRTTASGINKMQGALNQRMASMFSSGGAVSATGLVPAAQNLMNMLSSMFGVVLTSGHRPGSITESGNVSLHSMGRAIDVGGTAEQMRAVWNYMLGKGGVDELIYAGQIAENGGPPRPYGGANKHYDHVHIGLGDSSRGSGIPAAAAAARSEGKSITISFAGAVFHIKTDADYEAFMERFADDLERITGATGSVSAGGMLDAG